MKSTTLIKLSCYFCIVAGLACKLFLKNQLLGSILGIGLMALAVVILGITMYRGKRQ